MRRTMTLPLGVLGLSLAFVVVSCIVIVTRGKDSWVRRKLRLGALLLTFGATIHTACCPVTCYLPLPPNRISINAESPYVLNFAVSNEMLVTIRNRTADVFSFLLSMEDDERIFQRDEVVPDDGEFDEDTEHCTIRIDDTLPHGAYTLEFYTSLADEQRPEQLLWSGLSITLTNSQAGE